jgi:hypothetical protein
MVKLDMTHLTVVASSSHFPCRWARSDALRLDVRYVLTAAGEVFGAGD